MPQQLVTRLLGTPLIVTPNGASGLGHILNEIQCLVGKKDSDCGLHASLMAGEAEGRSMV